MHHRILLAHVALAALVAAGCNGSSENPTAPSSATPDTADAAADGSTLKATAPSPVSPTRDQRLRNRTPQLVVNNAQGRFASGAFSYEFNILNAGGGVIWARTVGGGSGRTSVLYPGQLEGNTRYLWRARAVMDGAAGPWSSTASFYTVAALPGCEARPLEADRSQCVASVAAVSENWPRCANGGHVGCHKFTRELATALAQSDPNWGLLAKPPGVAQCTLDRCGSSVVGGYGEDVVAYCRNQSTCRNANGPNGRRDWQGFDVVLGAGAPGARAHWSALRGANNRGNNYWARVP